MHDIRGCQAICKYEMLQQNRLDLVCRGCDVLDSHDAQLYSTESQMMGCMRRSGSLTNLKVTSVSASQMRIWMAGGLSPSLWLSTTALDTRQTVQANTTLVAAS